MATPQRRKSDRARASTPDAAAQPIEPARHAAEWIERCVELIRAAEPQMSIEEAAGIARELQAYERTGAMAPDAAVGFVVSEFGKGLPTRLERRKG